jgi:hypothetical protein
LVRGVTRSGGSGYHPSHGWTTVPRGHCQAEEAAKGIAESVTGQRDFKLNRLPGPSGMYGDIGLHDAMRDYCHQWNDGLDILTDDARTISDALSRAARAYRAVDEAVAAQLTTDPGRNTLDG